MKMNELQLYSLTRMNLSNIKLIGKSSHTRLDVVSFQLYKVQKHAQQNLLFRITCIYGKTIKAKFGMVIISGDKRRSDRIG